MYIKLRINYFFGWKFEFVVVKRVLLWVENVDFNTKWAISSGPRWRFEQEVVDEAGEGYQNDGISGGNPYST